MCALELSRLDDFAGDALKPREIEHHREAGPLPDVDDDHGENRRVKVGQKGLLEKAPVNRKSKIRQKAAEGIVDALPDRSDDYRRDDGGHVENRAEQGSAGDPRIQQICENKTEKHLRKYRKYSPIQRISQR